ncbi:Cold-regulated plasma membrane protein 1 [Cardamine amara subsp. amara]|uniref:Cold-regulated plasma membrane protein 1 n=1 Tax=Cardamine amara subsp. amara TaxID=228776 RepID=A0ABD1A1W5_CARAN
MTFTKMRRDHGTLKAVLGSDLNELGIAAKNLANHTFKLTGLGFGTSILEWVASIAAIYLLVLDRTNWKTNMLTSLLIPYIFFSLPSLIFNIFRGEIGKWIAFVAVVIQLFFPKHTREYLELPVALVILAVVAPELIAGTFRDSWVGLAICLGIGCYLLQEHIRASGGFRNAFTKANGISNTVGIIALVVFPVWALIF